MTNAKVIKKIRLKYLTSEQEVPTHVLIQAPNEMIYEKVPDHLTKIPCVILNRNRANRNYFVELGKLTKEEIQLLLLFPARFDLLKASRIEEDATLYGGSCPLVKSLNKGE
jgi:uncharacterized lipoprotein